VTGDTFGWTEDTAEVAIGAPGAGGADERYRARVTATIVSARHRATTAAHIQAVRRRCARASRSARRLSVPAAGWGTEGPLADVSEEVWLGAGTGSGIPGTSRFVTRLPDGSGGVGSGGCVVLSDLVVVSRTVIYS
jgi:hypothetical protein